MHNNSFPLWLTNRPNNLECLFLATFTTLCNATLVDGIYKFWRKWIVVSLVSWVLATSQIWQSFFWYFKLCHCTQHNDIWHNDTQHSNNKHIGPNWCTHHYDCQHNDTHLGVYRSSQCWAGCQIKNNYAECQNTKCHYAGCRNAKRSVTLRSWHWKPACYSCQVGGFQKLHICGINIS